MPSQPSTAVGSSARTTLLVVALFVVTLLVVGPYGVYAENVDDYSVSFRSMLGPALLPALVVGTALLILLRLVPRALGARLESLLFAGTLAAAAQAHALLGRYGQLDGSPLDLAANDWRTPWEALLWLGAAAASQLFHRRLWPQLPFLAGLLITVQLLATPLLGTDPTGFEQPVNVSELVPGDDIFTLSRNGNVILLIHDTVTSDTFQDLVAADARLADTVFTGFTHYADALGVYPRTVPSIAAMVGAGLFENRLPWDAFKYSVHDRATLNRELVARGWAVDWVGPSNYFCRVTSHTGCFAIPRPYASRDEHRRHAAAELLDISLFRHAPHMLKSWIYNGGRWRCSTWLAGESADPSSAASSAALFADLTDGLRVARDAPTLKLLHLAGGHAPLVLDPDCRLVPPGKLDTPAYARQVRCSLEQTAGFLQRLRTLGVYDDSLIIVAGDHGASYGPGGAEPHPLAPRHLSRARPMLLVKPPGADGPLRTSLAPAWLPDLAPTIAAHAGLDSSFEGRDLTQLAEGERRTRIYSFHEQSARKELRAGYLQRLERFVVEGPADEPGSWTLLEAVFPPDVRWPLDPLDLGHSTDDARLTYYGWDVSGRDGDDTTWRAAVGRAGVYFSMPSSVDAPRGVELRARLRAAPGTAPQTIDVHLDGLTVGQWTLDDSAFQEHTLTLTAGAPRSNPALLEFVPRHAALGEHSPRPLSFVLDRIAWRLR